MKTSSRERLNTVLTSFEPRQVESTEPTLSPDEVRFRSLVKRMENKTVSRTIAEQIVGGKVRLQNLIDEGKVRSFKPDRGFNSSWQINAADCYRNIRPENCFLLNNVKHAVTAI